MKYVMRKYFYSIVAVILTSSMALSEPNFYSLTEQDNEQILNSLSERMLDPESTRIRNMVAATKTEELVTVCGNVQAKNAYGGYAQPVAFMGYLVTERSGNKEFIIISIAESDSESNARVSSSCLDNL